MSLLDDENILISDDRGAIGHFLKSYYKIVGNWILRENNVVDIKGSLCLENSDIDSLTNGLFHFGSVTGGVYFNRCDKLKSLEGAPKNVCGNFSCHRCNSLLDFSGGPEEVGGFYTSECIMLKSLKGCPKIIHNGASCTSMMSLRSLEGLPLHINKDFVCDSCNNLIDLTGAPEYVGGNFSCSECLGLKDLTGAPKCVNGNFYCCNCTNLRSIKGIENTFINDMFDFSWCSHIEDSRYLPSGAQLICFEYCDIDSNVKLKIIEACHQRSIKIKF